MAKDLSASARTAVLAIIHTVAGLLVPWIEDQPRLYTDNINSIRQKGIFPSLQCRLSISTPAPWTRALMVQRQIHCLLLVWENRGPHGQASWAVAPAGE